MCHDTCNRSLCAVSVSQRIRELVDQNMLDEDCLLEFSQDWNGENTELITEEQRLGSHV